MFTFVSQHTVHLVYGSLRPDIRTVSTFKVVSTVSLLISSAVSLSVGVFVYMTFWQATKSDIFEIYPSSWMIDLAKLLLCITMLLTFPLPFFTCRELVIVTLIHPFCLDRSDDDDDNDVNIDQTMEQLQEPLLGPDERDSEEGRINDSETSSRNAAVDTTTTSMDNVSVVTELSRVVLETVAVRDWLLEDDDRQLKLSGHMAVTGKLWFVTTCFAIAAPNL